MYATLGIFFESRKWDSGRTCLQTPNEEKTNRVRENKLKRVMISNKNNNNDINIQNGKQNHMNVLSPEKISSLLLSSETNLALPLQNHKWSQKFLGVKQKTIESEKERRRLIEEEWKRYRPFFVNYQNVLSESELVESPLITTPYKNFLFEDFQQERKTTKASLGQSGRSQKSIKGESGCVLCEKKESADSSKSVNNTVDESSCLSSSFDHCELCSAMIHSSCLNSINSEVENLDKQSNEKNCDKEKTTKWWCPDCEYEVNSWIAHDKLLLMQFRKRRLEFLSSLKIQKYIRMVFEYERYHTLRNGVLRLQALARGVSDRMGFMNEIATTHRAFRVKIGEFSELSSEGGTTSTIPTSSSTNKNVSCILTLNNAAASFYSSQQQQHQQKQQQQMFMDTREEDENSSDNEEEQERNQFLRFETQTLQHGNSVRWNDTFMVYYSNSLVNFTFTVYERDDSLLKPNFLGQVVMDASKHLQIAFLCGKSQRYKLPLGPLKNTPLDASSFSLSLGKRSNNRNHNNVKKFRMDRTDFVPTSGKIWMEIHPISNVDSKCGVLEEILSAMLKGARKKWYAVLADRQLFLFSQFGDTRPKHTIVLTEKTRVMWHHKNRIMKIITMDHTWYLTSPGGPDSGNSWFTKLQGLYREMLYEGAKEFKEEHQQYCIDQSNSNDE